jgi:hypothetical protein
MHAQVHKNSLKNLDFSAFMFKKSYIIYLSVPVIKRKFIFTIKFVIIQMSWSLKGLVLVNQELNNWTALIAKVQL